MECIKNIRYKALLFDFDYTLADATAGIVASFQYGFEQMGMQHHLVEEIRKTVGMAITDAYVQLTGDHDREHALEFDKLFRIKAGQVMVQNTVLFPDTLNVLRGLRSAGIKTGIVTTKFRIRIDGVFVRFGMPDPVDIIIGGEEVKELKPSPEGIFLAMKRLGVRKEDTLYVGDNSIDADAAARAQVDFAAVLTGTTPKQAFEKYPHCFVEQNIGELMKRLGNAIKRENNA